MTWRNGTIIGGPHHGGFYPADDREHGVVIGKSFLDEKRSPVRNLFDPSMRLYRLHHIQAVKGTLKVWLPDKIPDEDAIGFILERAARP